MHSWTAILGWSIRYFEPTFGMQEFSCVGHDARAKLNAATDWLNAGGYCFTVRELPKA